MEEHDAHCEAVTALLAARAAVYALLVRLWSEPLDKAALATLVSSEWNEVLGLLDGDDEALAQGRVMLASAAQDQGTDGARRAYNWCFIGVGTRVAPWESVYRSADRLVMQPSTLEVREAYARAGFVARNKGAEPDDHVATECDFMAKLAVRAQEAFATDEEEIYREALKQSRDFLEEHLSRWASDFVAAFDEALAVEAGETLGSLGAQAVVLYGTAAAFAWDFYQADKALLDELLA